MARNTPPTRVSYTETAWNTTGGSKATASISWQTGDVLVFIGATESTNAITVPTATGLTFASKLSNVTSASCSTQAATAVAASSSSGAVTATTAAGFNWGFAVWVWRGSDGVGTFGEQHTTTHTKSIVPTDTHSAWMTGAFDFSAAAATNTLTPTVTNIDENAVENAAYTAYVGDIVDQASGASTAYGISAGGTTGVISLAIIEVLGTTGGGGGSTVKQLAALGVG